jgi:hypothetical protein
MTPGGWITLFLSVGFMVGLLGWCVWKLLRGGPVAPSSEDREALKDR